MVALVAHVFPLMSCLDNFPHSGIKVLWHLASEINSGEFFVLHTYQVNHCCLSPAYTLYQVRPYHGEFP